MHVTPSGGGGQAECGPHPLVAATHAWRTAELGTTPHPQEDSDPSQSLCQRCCRTQDCLARRLSHEADGTVHAVSPGVPLGVYSGGDGRCVNMGQWSRRLTVPQPTTATVLHSASCHTLINKSFLTYHGTCSRYSPIPGPPPVFSRCTLSPPLFFTLHASL